MRTRAFTMVFVTALVQAGAGMAQQPVPGDAAAAQLFPAEGIALAASRELDETQRLIVRTMASEAGRAGQDFSYYGSIAFSPSEGLTSESLQGAFNFHSRAAADSSALAACEQARPSGSAGCIVAGRILPQGWEERPLTLSQDATAAFEEVYVPAEPPKAMAVSPETGSWAIARGDAAAADAEARCNENATAKGGPAACRTVVAE